MSYRIHELEHLIDALQSLPSIGRKTATKWAYYLLQKDDKYINDLVTRIVNAKNKIKLCERCLNLSIKQYCAVCLSDLRFKNKLCIVSHIEDLQRIEDSCNYNGLYFVLHGEINIRQQNSYLQNLNKLVNMLKENDEIDEIIIATNFTASGQLTVKRIMEELQWFKGNIYRLGLGLPLNSALDYADNETIKHAFLNKSKLKG